MAELVTGAEAKKLKGELNLSSPAGAANYPAWLTSAMRASRLGQIMRQADTGNIDAMMALLGEILSKDGALQGLLNVRAASVCNLNIQCTIDKNDQSATPERKEEIKNFCQSILDNILLVRKKCDGTYIIDGGFKALTRRISINSSWFSFFAGWLVWDKKPGTNHVVPVAIEQFDNRSFCVDINDDSLLFKLKDGKRIPFQRLGEFNAVEIRHNGVNVKLAESGIGRAASYSWFIAFQTYVLLLRYCEMTAVPSPILERAGVEGITPGYAAGEDSEAMNFLKNYMAGIQAIMPAGFKLNWQEPGKGGHNIFDFIDKKVKSEYKDLLLGQGSTTSATGSSLGGLPIAGMAIQEYIVIDELTKICEAYRYILQMAVYLNYGPGIAAPKVEVITENYDKRKQNIDILKQAKELGFPITMQQAAEKLQIQVPVAGDPMLDGSIFGEAKDNSNVSIEQLKQKAQAINSAAYPLKTLLEAGVNVDVKQYADIFQFPLVEGEPAYTRPLQPGELPAGEAGEPTENSPGNAEQEAKAGQEKEVDTSNQTE